MNPFTFQTTPNVLFEAGSARKIAGLVSEFGALAQASGYTGVPWSRRTWRAESSGSGLAALSHGPALDQMSA